MNKAPIEGKVFKEYNNLSYEISKRLKKVGPIRFYDSGRNYPLLDIALSINAGGMDGKPGIAHFLEHILCNDDNSNGTNTKLEKDNRIKYNAGTGEFMTEFYYNCRGVYLGGVSNYYPPNSKATIEQAVKVFFKYHMLMNKIAYNTATEEEINIMKQRIEKHRKIIINEIETTVDKDFDKVNKLILSELLTEKGFSYHSKNNDILGTVDDVNSYTLDDLVDFYKNYYTENRLKVAISYPFSIVSITDSHQEDIINTIENIVSSMTSREEGTKPVWETEESELYKQDKDVTTVYCNREEFQGLFLSAKPTLIERYTDDTTYTEIPRFLKHLVTVDILRESISNIVDDLREKGLVYHGYKHPGCVEGKTSSNNIIIVLHSSNQEEIMNVIHDIIDKIKYNIKDFGRFIFEDAMRLLSKRSNDYMRFAKSHGSVKRYEYFRDNIPQYTERDSDIKRYISSEIWKNFDKDFMPLLNKYINEVLEEYKKALHEAKPIFIKYKEK